MEHQPEPGAEDETERHVFHRQRLEGAEFHQVYLPGASFRLVDLSGARFHNVYLQDARLTGVVLAGAHIDGDIRGLTVNGVEVGPLVEAELDRRHPDRALMRPTDAEGYRRAWRRLDKLWEETLTRARALEARSPGALDEQVDGEWSFLQTLRHLVFATDAWLGRVYLGAPAPYHPLGLAHEEEEDNPGLTFDTAARPGLDEVLEARRDRWQRVTAALETLTDERLTERTEPVEGPGYPDPDSYPVDRVLGGILAEEWEHRLFAERDLAVLEERHRADGTGHEKPVSATGDDQDG